MLSSLDSGFYRFNNLSPDLKQRRNRLERLIEEDSIDSTDQHRHGHDDIKEMEAILRERPQSYFGCMCEALSCCRCQ